MANNELVLVEGPRCPRCKDVHSVFVKAIDLDRYNNSDALIQECFPYLKREEREILISGLNTKCWKELMG